MTDQLPCAIVDEQDLVARFVAGRLSDDEADALEQHCLTCEQCWSELQLALRVSAAGHEARTAERPPNRELPRRSTSTYLTWLATAAVFLLIVGIVKWERQSPAAVVERGAFERLHVTTARTATGGARVEWRAIQGATRYVVTVTQSDGRPVASREVSESMTTFDDIRTAIGAGHPVVTVEAFDALGNRLGESSPIPVP